MMNLRRQLKTDARVFLRVNWSSAVATVLIWALAICLLVFFELLFNLVFGVTTAENLFALPTIRFSDGSLFALPTLWILAAVTLLSLLLLPPFYIGRANWYLDSSYRPESGVLFVPFSSFRQYGHSLYVSLHLILRKLIIGVLFGLPAYGLGMLAYVGQIWWGWQASWSLLLLIVAGLLGLLGAFLYFVFIQRYLLVPYLALREPRQGVLTMFRLSRSATRGLCTELATAKLSFIFWLLASLFIFPLLYAMPYYEMTVALYARYLLETRIPSKEVKS